MTTPGTMNNILERLRDKIEDAERDAKCSESKSHVEDQNYVTGYARGYAEALKELWFDITGDKFAVCKCPPGARSIMCPIHSDAAYSNLFNPQS